MILLYIDPGTGSMLFSVFIGLAAATYFVFRTLIIKLKSFFSGKRKLSYKHSNFVIYNEANHYWPVFCDILNEFENRKIELLYLTSSEDDPVFKNNYIYIKASFIGSGNNAFMTLNFLDADICLMTTPGLDVYQLKRSKLCKHYSHILHDTGDATCYKLFGLDWFDSVLLSGEYQKKDIRLLEELRSLPEKELIVVGSTYLDYYSNKLNDITTEEDHIFTVLVSPSWGPGSILNEYGDTLLQNLSCSEWRIIVRPHPQSRISETEMLDKLEKKYNSFIWDYKSENLDSLSKADIMISDFSGILFDFAFLFKRPLIYHNSRFNKEMYDASDLDHEPWKFNAIRQFGTELVENDLSNITDIINKIIYDTKLIENLYQVKKIAWQNIGQSEKKVVDYLINTHKEICQNSILI